MTRGSDFQSDIALSVRAMPCRSKQAPPSPKAGPVLWVSSTGYGVMVKAARRARGRIAPVPSSTLTTST